MALPSRAAFSVLCLVLVPAFLVLAEQPPRTPRPISIADYFQIRVVSDPDLSPEGGFVTYTVESRLLKEDKNEDRIWMVPTAGRVAGCLAAGGRGPAPACGGRASAPRRGGGAGCGGPPGDHHRDVGSILLSLAATCRM